MLDTKVSHWILCMSIILPLLARTTQRLIIEIDGIRVITTIIIIISSEVAKRAEAERAMI